MVYHCHDAFLILRPSHLGVFSQSISSWSLPSSFRFFFGAFVFIQKIAWDIIQYTHIWFKKSSALIWYDCICKCILNNNCSLIKSHQVFFDFCSVIPRLHAYKLSLKHPADDKPVTFVAKLPDDMRQLILRRPDYVVSERHLLKSSWPCKKPLKLCSLYRGWYTTLPSFFRGV